MYHCKDIKVHHYKWIEYPIENCCEWLISTTNARLSCVKYCLKSTSDFPNQKLVSIHLTLLKAYKYVKDFFSEWSKFVTVF